MREMFYIKLFFIKKELYNQRKKIKDIIILKIESYTFYCSSSSLFIYIFENTLLICRNNK